MLESLFNKVTGRRASKKRIQHRRVNVNIVGTPTMKDICEWLFLKEGDTHVTV